ncbi:MAG: hypothetical protein WC313_04325 [Candidatus Kapaibacterium sp.]|jgi:hypothetical protein|nr:hypothetical protein [Candidatus Kapabacteria bacterium]
MKYLIILLVLSVTSLYSKEFANLQEKVEFYKTRYKVNCLNEKITDNHGNGFDELYGTRNMRTILYGIAYRGGANNYFHKSDKRDNHNPLPQDGLTHLCMHGFSDVVYLYSKNFSTAPKEIINPNTHDTLKYHQYSGNDRKEMKKILLMIKEVIDNPSAGPVYLHCWNGWHQSGYVSSAILMQFCDLSNEQAYKYWIDNTDGVNKGYENVKSMVKNFKTFDDIQIPKETKDLICPCISSK